MLGGWKRPSPAQPHGATGPATDANTSPPDPTSVDITIFDPASVLERFEDAWQGGARPALEKYLPPEGHPGRGGLVLELVKLDLEYRLRAGDEAPLVGVYLRLYGAAFSAAEQVGLIGLEYQLRWERWEPGLRRLEYLRRFPQHAAELEGRLRPRWDCTQCNEEGITLDDEAAKSATCPRCGWSGTLRREITDLQPVRPTQGEQTFPAIEGYEVEGELGRGGMGVVYKAKQVGLKRTAAIKMILSGPLAGVEQRARFRAEAQAVARLQHPHIVQIYEIGEHEGKPYFSLEFVEGGSLDKKLAGNPQPPREAARLISILAEAVHFAHQKGVVHRDLKPGNVLLTRDEQPKITDFGLCKDLESDLISTVEGAILGTPLYMAPEQASGSVKAVGRCTDVYALSAILYEMLTGRPPFRGTTYLETLEQVRRQEPVPPRQLQPKGRASMALVPKQSQGYLPAVGNRGDPVSWDQRQSVDLDGEGGGGWREVVTVRERGSREHSQQPLHARRDPLQQGPVGRVHRRPPRGSGTTAG
jgi:predicted Ser/Thr protein kinase